MKNAEDAESFDWLSASSAKDSVISAICSANQSSPERNRQNLNLFSERSEKRAADASVDESRTELFALP